MPKDKLLEDIEQARAELHAVADLNPEDRDIVGNLVTDVVAHLSDHKPVGSGAKQQMRQSLVGRLEQQVAELEARHPRLSSALNRVATMLSSLGI